MAYSKNKKSRQLTQKQLETRRLNAKKSKIMKICKSLEIPLYVKSIDDDDLYQYPDYFRCVFPEEHFGCIYYPDADDNQMYVWKFDFDTIKGRIR